MYFIFINNVLWIGSFPTRAEAESYLREHRLRGDVWSRDEAMTAQHKWITAVA